MTDPALEAIAARRAAWSEATAAGDVEAVARVMTEDVAWIPPGIDALVGRAAVKAWLAPLFERWAYDVRFEPEAVWTAGPLAVDFGRFASRLTPADGGEPAEHGGRYLILWRRGDDGWRIDRYVDVTAATSG